MIREWVRISEKLTDLILRFSMAVFCELEWSAIYDADINEKGKSIDKIPNEEELRSLLINPLSIYV